MSDDQEKSIERTSRLLGDLESIRSVLDDEREVAEARSRPGGHSHKERESARGQTESAADDADEDVPLLEDVVQGGVSLHETFLSGEGDFEDVEGTSSLDDDMFKALLSDEWRESARDLLDQARAVIEKHQTEWTPAHTDELNQALKIRIDETVEQWLRQVIQERLDELRNELLEAMADELRATVSAQFAPTSKSHDEDPDGA